MGQRCGIKLALCAAWRLASTQKHALPSTDTHIHSRPAPQPHSHLSTPLTTAPAPGCITRLATSTCSLIAWGAAAAGGRRQWAAAGRGRRWVHWEWMQGRNHHCAAPERQATRRCECSSTSPPLPRPVQLTLQLGELKQPDPQQLTQRCVKAGHAAAASRPPPPLGEHRIESEVEAAAPTGHAVDDGGHHAHVPAGRCSSGGMCSGETCSGGVQRYKVSEWGHCSGQGCLADTAATPRLQPAAPGLGDLRRRRAPAAAVPAVAPSAPWALLLLLLL